ncbi:MAG: biliverdin-producing heme oxygenase [Gammaproteobacteria bacterium]
MRTNTATARRILGAVRSCTSTLHKELDQHVQGDRALAGDMSRDHYIRTLKAHWALHCLVAQHTADSLANTREHFLDWPECERLEALSCDLNALGVTLGPSDLSDDTVQIQGVAFTAGLLYVVEGACLGNKQMLKALIKNNEFVAWGASRFMQLSGDSISQRWPQTLALLCKYGDHQLDAVMQGAIAGFTFYQSAWDKASTRPIATVTSR